MGCSLASRMVMKVINYLVHNRTGKGDVLLNNAFKMNNELMKLIIIIYMLCPKILKHF